ncbi:hypothetical protein AQI95_25260 [Streptomyces yokosukanensis]|uniref:Uncharacterized protein n=1 Tax=Streptomyces yokosukanensis TaxID=67386 RepID=A0A101P0V8_9ACTN|nr:hypothetical protein [Streptomyces yokosukanensis]KUN02843.1 hypothetical protein AQI95_25260 [Streptomyces yokosukanensis]
MTSTEEATPPNHGSVPAQRTGSDPELDRIAGRIRVLADRARADGSDTRVLDRVAADLERGGATLAGTDLVTAYPPDVLLPDVPAKDRGTLEGWLGVTRDVLVFAPIALTWWRLRGALDAYDATRSEDPFLLGWARGFPKGSPPEPTTVTLGTSALHVTLLILVVVVLTLTLHALQRSRERRLSREEERGLLATELALATFLLSTPARPAGKPLDTRSADKLASQLNAGTETLVTALRRTSEEITAVLETGPGSRIETALDGWTKTVDELTRLIRTLTPPGQLAQDLIRIREQTAEDEAKLRAAIETLVAELRSTQEATGQEIHRHDLAVATVRDLARGLGETLLVFTERAENLVDSTRGIWQLVDRLDSRPGHLPAGGLDNADPPPYRGRP